MSFCCLCLSPLSWGDSRHAGGVRYSAGGGDILHLATSSSSSSSFSSSGDFWQSVAALPCVKVFRPVALIGSFVDEVSGVGRGEFMVTA